MNVWALAGDLMFSALPLSLGYRVAFLLALWKAPSIPSQFLQHAWWILNVASLLSPTGSLVVAASYLHLLYAGYPVCWCLRQFWGLDAPPWGGSGYRPLPSVSASKPTYYPYPRAIIQYGTCICMLISQRNAQMVEVRCPTCQTLFQTECNVLWGFFFSPHPSRGTAFGISQQSIPKNQWTEVKMKVLFLL